MKMPTWIVLLTALAFGSLLAEANNQQQQVDWAKVDSTSGVLPEGALKAGMDSDGNSIYIARMPYEKGLLVGKYIPALRMAFFSYGGAEITAVSDIEVFTGFGIWQYTKSARLPKNAIAGGYENNGDKLYILLAKTGNAYNVGKYSSSYSMGYVPWQGKEIELIGGFFVLTGTQGFLSGLERPKSNKRLDD